MYVEGGGDMVSLVFPHAIFGSQHPYYLVLFFLCPPPHSITHNCGQNTMSFFPPHTHPSPSFRLLMHHPLTFHVKNTQSHNVYAHKVC